MVVEYVGVEPFGARGGGVELKRVTVVILALDNEKVV